VFLDRDGTLNEERDFVNRPEDLHLIAGASRAVRQLNDHGLVTIVISNQSGVARGFFSESDLALIHSCLKSKLGAEGAKVDGIYYCPHHPKEGLDPYRIDCDCRKPHAGMLKRGETDFGLDLRTSYVVGDKLSDIGAGRAVGAHTILVLTGYGEESLRLSEIECIKPDLVVPSIVEAVEFIILRLPGRLK
jgi:D-glycero-D-manno-heptose 1,7-bisphosphate phosphatase